MAVASTRGNSMIGIRGGVVVLGAIMALASLVEAAAPPDPSAPLVCRRVKRLRAPLATPDTSVVPGDGAAVELHDRFDVGTRPTSVKVHRMRVLCAPAGTTTAPAGESALAGFAVQPLPGARPRPIDVDHTVETLLGPTAINVRALQRLMASADTAPAGERPDGFDPSLATQHTCYEVRPEDDRRVRRLDLLTADGAWQLRASRPRHLCVPVGTRRDPSRPDYLCWQAKLRRGAPVLPKVAREATSVFGRERVRLGEVRELCLPTETELVPPPPPPGFELELDPPAQEIEWRERARYRAIARWDDGRTQDVTPQVAWTSADERIAAPALDDDGVYRGREPGSVVVRITEPLSGKTATATLGVRWSLERIELSPRQVNRAVGQHEDYQATGWFAGGVHHNVTDRLTYTTSDAAVAAPADDGATPSRVVPKAHGTVTVSACDPQSGVCSGGDDDATMIVLGGLQSIELGPHAEIAVGVGEILPLTATGRYADGRRKNLTRKVEWRVADARVAEPGEHGVLIALAAGRTTVTAVDPKTGLGSPARSVSVLGAMQSLVAYDTPLSPHDMLRPGDAIRMTAVASYEGGRNRNVTQRVVWESLDPTHVATPNTPGDRSRVIALAPGPGTVVARDPVSGLTSAPATVHVLGELVELVAEARGVHRDDPIPIGSAAWATLSGRFASGPTPWLTRLNFHNYRPADEYEMFSTDPSVLQPATARGSVRGVGPGTASVWFRDEQTGITSNLVTFTVKGEMERITLEPAAITRGIGESEEYLALGRHQPDLTTLLSQDLVYASSDERVAIATNEPGNRSRVVAVGPGTAVISAVHPVTGMRAEDAVITVLPGTIERITISPAVRLLPIGGFEDFTATGHYPDGRTLNVTSQVAWTSSAPQVAPARGQCGLGCWGQWWFDEEMGGGTSRVVGAAAGTVFLTATHAPSGVSSSHSGHDAVVVVEDVARLDLLPPEATLAVGEVLPYRTRAVLTGGQTIDVSEQVSYRTDDFAIAWNDVDPDVEWDVRGRVNAIVAKAPGSATVIASMVWGASAEASLTVVAPTSTTTTTSTSTTLPSGATLAVDPPARTVDFAEQATFRAMIGTVDVTDRAEWTVVDGTIASGDAGVFQTRDPGTTTVTAHDPVTGMRASATLIVGWSLRSIEVYPKAATRRPGGRVRFQAIGHFAAGRTIDLSARARFAVSNGAVAAVAPDAEHAGELVALADGVTQVIACDLRSAICAGSDRPALLRVDADARQFLVSQFVDGSSPLMAGRHADLEVRVYYLNGDEAEEDVAADVTWTMDPPDVVRLVREGPTGLRVYGLRPGTAQVRFERGPLSTFHDMFVRGPLAQLFATVSEPFEVGKAGAGLAWGYDAGGLFRRVTYDVEWRSLDPDVVATPNDPAKPNLLVGVSPGTARIVARDPATGIESAPVNALAYGGLARVDTDPKDTAGEPAPWLTVGAQTSLRARAVFEGGYTRCVACRWPYRAVRWESSDPSVIEVDFSWNGRATVRAVGHGQATVRAIDEQSGLSGAGMTWTVIGGLDRIELQPAGAVVRGIGEREWLTAIGHRAPGVTSNLTPSVWWESSDPSVATVSNDRQRRGEIRTHAAGTAVISARAGDVSSTTTGDDVTITVLPGRLERIVVSPAFSRVAVGEAEEFTATGYYPDGTTLNVTQQVEWQVEHSSVAGAFGPPNRRSLIEGVMPFTTGITAVHPSGVSSADSGESARLQVDAVVAIHLWPAPRHLTVGQVEELTVVAELASGERRNVTQLADYVAWPPAPVVLDVPNAASRKSRFTATAPGEAEVVVSFAGQTARAAITVAPAP